MDRVNGPLRSLVLWYAFAVRSWPRAKLIGKAEEDVWLYLPSVLNHLKASLDFARAQQGTGTEPLLYWGIMESTSFETNVSRSPMGPISAYRSRYGYGYQHGIPTYCNITSDGTIGPTSIAKGPLHFMSLPLARDVMSSKFLQYNLSEDLANFRFAQSLEDVRTGLALATAVAKRPGLTMIHAGAAVLWEQYSNVYHGPRNNTFVWHLRYKTPDTLLQVKKMNRWASKYHCGPFVRHAFACGSPYTSCTGAQWRRCEMVTRYQESGCSSMLPRECPGAKPWVCSRMPE